jgi:rare lipoprotein A
MALLLAIHACATHRPPAPLTSIPVGTVQEGIASWYGPGYHGKRTSSGERFDQDELTAAHPTWPLGTQVRVTLLSTGKSCVVRINDRFGGRKGRIVDLSEAPPESRQIGPGSGRYGSKSSDSGPRGGGSTRLMAAVRTGPAVAGSRRGQR